MRLGRIEETLVTGSFLLNVRKKIDGWIASLYRRFWARRQKIQPNKIVLKTFRDSYDCNLKYIAEEILRQELPYELIWLTTSRVTEELKAAFPPGITVVRKQSYQGLYHAATARIWLDNALNLPWPPSVPKKKGQIYINTWHGSMGLKRIGKNDVQGWRWKHIAKKCNKITDYCISDSAFETNVYRETYWKSVPILEYGHARNDILFKTDPREMAQIREKVLEQLNLMLPIPEDFDCLYPKMQERILASRKAVEDLKFVLYAPTFRDSKRMDIYDVDFERLTAALHRRFGGIWKVLLRFHYQNRAEASGVRDQGCVINASSYPDMQELLTIADVGITDYSSWICDYALTGKPAFFYAADLDEYNNERGLYYKLETTPFPVAENNEELAKNIEEFDAESFEKKRIAFLQDKGCIEDGHAAERVVELIKKEIGERS